MDPWNVVESLADIHYMSNLPHEIGESFGTAIGAVDALIAQGVAPSEAQSEALDVAQKAVLEYWLYIRFELRSADFPKPSPREDSMMISMCNLPWILMSKMHLYRVLFEYDIQKMQSDSKGAFIVWKRRPFALEILTNVEGRIVCDVAPCTMTLPQIIAVFHVITAKWRMFGIGHYERLYEYTELLLGRLFLMSALNPESPREFLECLSLLDRGKFVVPDGLVYEFEMHAHVFMYNWFVTKLFRIVPFCEWVGFDADMYVKTKWRLETWLRKRLDNGTFTNLRACFSSDMRDLCARPTQRDRIARMRGLRRVSTREVLAEEEAQEDMINDYLSTPNLIQQTLAGEVGTVFQRQMLFVRVFDMFFNQNFSWPFVMEHTFEEAQLADLGAIAAFSREIERPMLIFLCGVYMLALNGCLYPVTNFLDAMTQFVLVTLDEDIAMQYSGFYNNFADIHAIQPTDEDLEQIEVDPGVYDVNLVDRRDYGFIEDTDSEDE